MREVLLQYDGLEVLLWLKQSGILLAADEACSRTEGVTEAVTMTSEVVLDKVRVNIAAGAEDAVSHPVPALLDLSYHKHSRVHDGPLTPALGPAGHRVKLCH